MNSKNAWMLTAPLLVSVLSIGAAGASEELSIHELKADYTAGGAGEAGVNVGRGQQVGTGVSSRAASSWLIQGDLVYADADDPSDSGELVDERSLEVSTRPSAVGLTASMLVAALPNEGFEFPYRDPPPDLEGGVHPKGQLAERKPAASLEAPEEQGGAGWLVGGALVGALTLGVPLGIGAEAAHGNVGLGVGVGIAAGVVGGVGGYFLGSLARDGSSAAKSSITILAVVDVLVGVAAVAFAASFKMNTGFFRLY